MPKVLGKIEHPRDIVCKEYVDDFINQLDVQKIEESDLQEFTNEELLELWNQIMQNN